MSAQSPDPLVRAILQLADHLSSGTTPYEFHTPTPETHAKVLRRLALEHVIEAGDQSSGAARAASTSSGNDRILSDKLVLRAKTDSELWGWSLPLDSSQQEAQYLPASEQDDLRSQLVQHDAATGTSLPLIRLSNLYLPSIRPNLDRDAHLLAQRRQAVLYAHSAFPTSAQDSVFFGPDTYRFVRFLHESLGLLSPPRGAQSWKMGVDVGTGAGAGAIVLAGLRQSEGVVSSTANQRDAQKPLINTVLGTDINRLALRFAQANSELYRNTTQAAPVPDWSSRLDFRLCSLLSGLTDTERSDVDLIVSNPPYIAFDTPGDQGDNSGSSTTGGATYADGGKLGIALPLLILRDALDTLPIGGVCLLYTGVPILMSGPGSSGRAGINPLWSAVRELEANGKAKVEYWDTMDSDVFGDEMVGPEAEQRGPASSESAKLGAYARTGVARIEVVGVAVRKTS
ncbi:unnamed protein product [Jaminaea pallidilutea]